MERNNRRSKWYAHGCVRPLWNHQSYPISSAYTTYTGYLSALGSNTGDVSSFYWPSPGDGTGANWSQGLVAQAAPVPVPPSVFLLAPGLLGLVGMRRRFKL